MSYSIKVLKNEEFDKLPFKHSSIALGVADPKTNTAYVRYSAHPELNKYLIDHEFEHLVEEIPTDEIEGVRYKIPILGPLASGLGSVASFAAPAIGGLAKGAGGLLGGFGGLLGKGASSLFNVGKSAVSGIGSLASKAGSGIMNMFGGGLGGSAGGGGGLPTQAFQPISSAIKSVPQQAKPGLLSGFTGIGSPMGQFLGSPIKQATSGLPKGFASVTSTIPKAVSGIGQIASQPKSSFLDDLFSGEGASGLLGSLGGFLPGIGSLALGLGKDYPKIPELPSSVESLRSLVSAGGSPLAQLAQSVLSSQLGQQYNPLSEEEIQAATRQLELDESKEIDALNDLYRNLRPGTDPSTDSSYRRDLQEIRDKYARAKTDQLATRTRETKSIFQDQQARAIQQSLGVSDSQIEQLMNLALLDVNKIAQQLQIDLQSAQNFKDVFTQLGSKLLMSSFGISSSPTFNITGG